MNLFILFHFSKCGNHQKKSIKRERGMTKEPTGNAIPPTKPFCHIRSMGLGRGGLRGGGGGEGNPIAPSCKDASVTREGTPTVRPRSPTVTSVLDLCMPVVLWWARWSQAPVLKQSQLYWIPSLN